MRRVEILGSVEMSLENFCVIWNVFHLIHFGLEFGGTAGTDGRCVRPNPYNDYAKHSISLLLQPFLTQNAGPQVSEKKTPMLSVESAFTC